MSNIEGFAITPSFQNPVDDNTTALNFNDKVLSYLQRHQPDEKLNDLRSQLCTLRLDERVTLQQFSSALLSADGEMRKEEKYQEYTHNVLDNLTIRMIGVNMFYNNMMYKSFMSSDIATSS